MSTDVNRETMRRGLDLVRDALRPYVCTTLQAHFKQDWWQRGVYYAMPPHSPVKLPKAGDEHDFNEKLDLAATLIVIERNWNEVFAPRLDKQAKNYLYLIRDTRNSLAHDTGVDVEMADAIFALEAMARFLASTGSAAAKRVEALTRTLTAPPPPVPAPAPAPAAKPGTAPLTQPAATSRAKAGAASTAQSALPLGMRPWREVILPHRDVQEGRLLEAEFVVNLADVVAGKAEVGYQEPVGFFERTYLTSGLRELLTVAVRRLGGAGGEPVAQLKTAFGGGKTHTMLALYHLARAGAVAASLPGMAEIFAEAGVNPDDLAGAEVAVLVSTALDATREHLDSTGNGIMVRTLWGELAAQLGGPEGYTLVEKADHAGRSPGSDTLVQLLTRSGPTLILIDELVAYARNLVGRDDLPGGTFDAVMTFVQALTEAAKRSPRCLVVASIPESEVEIGNEAGRVAQVRLEHTFGRMEAIWKPVAPTEGFEIVRRRLFGQVVDEKARDAVCREFLKLYQNGAAGDFPPDTATPAYLDELRRCYPIHPEIFYQLYNHWSTLPRFQRTRGVLRLMATVIHALWIRGDQSKLILPGTLPLDYRDVRSELLRYLEPTWDAVVDKDVDGESSEPAQLDKTNPRLGQHQAARRVARTIFVASAPHVHQQGVRGVEEARIRLGTVEPNLPLHIPNEALRLLADRLTYLYSGNGRHWYDTRPNLNRTADERAAQLPPYTVADEIRKRLTNEVSGRASTPDNPFGGVHVFANHGDVPDDGVVRLVVLPSDAAHQTGRTSAAAAAARSILEQRGTMPRLATNMLVFLAPDQEGVESLQKAVRQFLAWTDIHGRQDELNLDAHGRRQARENAARWDETVNSRTQEAYAWLLVPRQDASGPWTFDIRRIPGQSPYLRRVTAALRQDQQLVETLSPKVLQIHLKEWFWKENAPHIEVRRLWEAFTNYGYLERLRNQQVLRESIATGVRSSDFFGYASGVTDGRYEGLVAGELFDASQVTLDGHSVLVRPEIALRQLEADAAKARKPDTSTPEETDRPGTGGTTGLDGGTGPAPGTGEGSGTTTAPPPPALLRRYHGSVVIDTERIVRDASAIADEVIQHLTKVEGARVRVAIEIEAEMPAGAPDDVVRTVMENGRTLKFRSSGFEES